MKVLEFLMLYILSRLIYNVSEKEGKEQRGGRVGGGKKAGGERRVVNTARWLGLPPLPTGGHG